MTTELAETVAAGLPPVEDHAARAPSASSVSDRHSAAINLEREDSSLSVIGYFSNGSKGFPKERVTVFAGGRTLVNENFRRLESYGWPRVRTVRLWRQEKGHAAGVAAFLDAVRGAPAPISFEEIIEVSGATLLAGGRGW